MTFGTKLWPQAPETGSACVVRLKPTLAAATIRTQDAFAIQPAEFHHPLRMFAPFRYILVNITKASDLSGVLSTRSLPGAAPEAGISAQACRNRVGSPNCRQP